MPIKALRQWHERNWSMRKNFWLFAELLRDPAFLFAMTLPGNIAYALISQYVFRRDPHDRDRNNDHDLAPFFDQGRLVANPFLIQLRTQFFAMTNREFREHIEYLNECGHIDILSRPLDDDEPYLLALGSWGVHPHAGSNREHY
jgi:hypothetical protein